MPTVAGISGFGRPPGQRTAQDPRGATRTCGAAVGDRRTRRAARHDPLAVPTRRPRGARRRDAAEPRSSATGSKPTVRRSRRVSPAVRWSALVARGKVRGNSRLVLLAATRVDGSGETALRIAEDLAGAVQDAATDLRTTHEGEVEALDIEIERAGYPPRRQALYAAASGAAEARGSTGPDRSAPRGDHGVGVDVPRRPGDRGSIRQRRPGGAPSTPVARPMHSMPALVARRAFEFNPNEGLLLERLILHLPAVGGAPPR